MINSRFLFFVYSTQLIIIFFNHFNKLFVWPTCEKNLLFILFLALIKYIKKDTIYIYLNKVITKEKNLYLLIVIILNLLF